MKLRMNIFLLLVIALSISAPLSLSCSDPFGPSISDVMISGGMTDDFHPQDAGSSFYIDSPQVCCTARLQRAHKNTAVTAKWFISREYIAATDNPLIYEDTLYYSADGNVGFALQPGRSGFMRGEYHVEIFIDGKPGSSSEFNVGRDSTLALPRIDTFVFTPATITAGQTSLLSWQVTGATRITIQPSPGVVDASGSKDIAPPADTSYTIYAVNRGGSCSSTISIKVTPAAKGKADLEALDLWQTGNILFYKVRNTGNAPSCPSTSALYKNNLKETDDYVAPLEPGEERVESFATYHFSPRFSAFINSAQEEIIDTVNMRVCLNDPASCQEISMDNNCLDRNYGPLLSLNLLKYAASAEWQDNNGNLKWPMLKDKTNGWAALGTAYTSQGSYINSLLLFPGAATGNWIMARIGIPRGSPPILQPFTIPPKSKLICKVGITGDAPGDASAKFVIGIKQGSDIEFSSPITVKATSQPENIELDLSKLAGKQVEFVIRVESGKNLEQGSIAWIDPVLSQQR